MKKSEIKAGHLGLAAAFAVAAFVAAPAAQAQVVSKDASASAQPAPARSATARRGLITGTMSPRPVQLSDGTVLQELDESSLVYMVVTRNADGTLSDACVTGADAANAIVTGKQSIARNGASSKEHRHDVK